MHAIYIYSFSYTLMISPTHSIQSQKNYFFSLNLFIFIYCWSKIIFYEWLGWRIRGIEFSRKKMNFWNWETKQNASRLIISRENIKKCKQSRFYFIFMIQWNFFTGCQVVEFFPEIFKEIVSSCMSDIRISNNHFMSHWKLWIRFSFGSHCHHFVMSPEIPKFTNSSLEFFLIVWEFLIFF